MGLEGYIGPNESNRNELCFVSHSTYKIDSQDKESRDVCYNFSHDFSSKVSQTLWRCTVQPIWGDKVWPIFWESIDFSMEAYFDHALMCEPYCCRYCTWASQCLLLPRQFKLLSHLAWILPPFTHPDSWHKTKKLWLMVELLVDALYRFFQAMHHSNLLS